jgi:ribulose-phosphate 3-epimerase
MVKEPEKYVEKYLDKIEMFLIHFESVDNAQSVIDLVKSKGKKVGLVINPETSVQEIQAYLDEIDQVLVMTVNPGFYGSKFLPECLDKVKQLRKLKPSMDIEVDGGINDKTGKLASEAGANLLVSGSFVVKAENPKEAIEILKEV